MRRLWLLVFALGCGNDSSNQEAPTESEAQSLCRDMETRFRQCRLDFVGESQCVREFSCKRWDVAREMLDCLEETPCRDWGRECRSFGEPLEIHEDVAWECRRALSDCGRSSRTIEQECDLQRWTSYSTRTMERLRDCYAESCSSINACTRDAMDLCE